ncbi:MAG: hypothetical protein RR954_01620 [Christensenellaceae bacterium]
MSESGLWADVIKKNGREKFCIVKEYCGYLVTQAFDSYVALLFCKKDIEKYVAE